MTRGPNDPYRFDISELHPDIAKCVERTDIFQFEGSDYEYGVLNPSVAPIHNVVGMLNGQNLIGSSTIPDQLKLFYLGHEILCNRVNAGIEGRCASVEAKLITEATSDVLRLLLQERLRTFEDLVRVYKISLEHPESAFHAEIAGTTIYLRQKVAELGIN